jgi:IS1 family transposase
LRTLSGDATDRDSAEFTLRNLIFVSSERAVDTISEILDRDEISDYRNQDPTVLNYWDRTQQERGQGADQPAEIYLWEPAGEDIERFSLDNTSTQDTASVEALVYSLDEQEVVEYAEDARSNIEQFFDDNKQASEWQTIEVTSVNDLREQTQRRNTDQYVVSLEIELEKINDV